MIENEYLFGFKTKKLSMIGNKLKISQRKRKQHYFLVKSPPEHTSGPNYPMITAKGNLIRIKINLSMNHSNFN